ncbi:hypothetical protein [Nitrosomonas sp.]|uniref:hypothetical protein n=1 Tax=Nitrosomonas sp. TaxID=42353 RepID=UPI00272FDB97|nr:hypothetical protein [Nitrosomonas sp.]MDP2223191.1 hypothetical protein [Nitrosomonas sp.]
MAANILSFFSMALEKIWNNKIISVLIVILAILACLIVKAKSISIDELNTPPEHLFLSKTIQPNIIELNRKSITGLKEQLANIKSIIVFTEDKNQETQDLKVTYLVTNAEAYTQPYHSSFGEIVLQHASGSNLAFATNCKGGMQRYKHGECTGPTYYEGTDIIKTPRVCECVPR